jgi:ribonuclease BN (tRNA processing enzyme)
MQITVLGKSPSWQDADGACSGYLVCEGSTRLLVDCGNGVFGKLRVRCDYAEVSAIAVSHLHADHYVDLVGFACGLAFAPRHQPVPVDRWPGTANPPRPRVHIPPGAPDAFRALLRATGHQEHLLERAFDLRPYRPDDEVAVGDLRLRFHPVPHFIPTYAIDVRSAVTDARFTFGADCAPNDALIDFARDTDLLLVEATLPRPERSGPRGHLTPEEAGDHGRRAGARRLVLTHFSDELDPDWLRAEAERRYGGAVDLAAEGAVYEL